MSFKVKFCIRILANSIVEGFQKEIRSTGKDLFDFNIVSYRGYTKFQRRHYKRHDKMKMTNDIKISYTKRKDFKMRNFQLNIFKRSECLQWPEVLLAEQTFGSTFPHFFQTHASLLDYKQTD